MLSNRYVRTIILSRVLLQMGIWIRNFAVLLYVTDLTDNDPIYVSLISVVEFAPIFIFAIIGGTFADRWRPKRTMLWSDLLSALSVVFVLAALLNGAWYALLLGTFVSASLSQFSQPSAMKLYKNHVPAEDLQSVMAMSQSLTAVFMVLGPIIGTFVFLQYGIEVSLVVTTLMFLGSSVILSLLPRDTKETSTMAGAGFMKEMLAGLRYVGTNHALRTLSAAFAASGLAAGMVQPLLLFVTIENLGQDKQFLQWLLMANGAAMLLGGIVIMGVAKKVQPQVLLASGLVVSAFCTIGAGASTVTLLTMMIQIISGFFYPCIQVGIQTLIIRNTESTYIGRVGGAITPVFMGMMVIGMSVAGYLKDVLSLFSVYSASAALLLLGALLLTPLLQKQAKPQDVAR
ncbi:MFS transporter [Paenibacillus sp. FJAT-26967]|uniref:MFS transporter n=1 Tax=Paenibacillus sp. FJAT-26967 TaxID=1729690 RepID=UPI000838C832|nr:MFS transporter [Paenibacillus sp. FJAT-26967]